MNKKPAAQRSDRLPADRPPRDANEDRSDDRDLATGEGGAIEIPAKPGDIAKDDEAAHACAARRRRMRTTPCIVPDVELGC